jgi:uncharacterized membrane protein
MFDGNGLWVVFPIICLIFMVIMMTRMFGSRRQGSGGSRGMGPMGMGGHSDEESEQGESPLDILRRRYAAGELTDDEFDAMRRKLEHRV